ncbi:MAG: hypothetical protein KC422_01560 [Trueperaceae bacterium]|nr:hypothetical protein [Trueperaceae bacterium]
MSEHPVKQAVIIQLQVEPLQFQVKNLRTGELAKFNSWSQLLEHLKTIANVRGLR